MATKRKSRGQSLLQKIAGGGDAHDSPAKLAKVGNFEFNPETVEKASPSNILGDSKHDDAAPSPPEASNHVAHVDLQHSSTEPYHWTQEQDTLLKHFQSLDLVVNTFRARRQIAVFPR